MNATPLNDEDFKCFQNLVFNTTGMRLAISKKNLVVSRLSRRLRELELDSFSAYINVISNGESPDERQVAIDLLTTNETYFFREQPHFDFLNRQLGALSAESPVLRVWSAACSTGQEAFSIAMMLHDQLGNSGWEITGSDISLQVVHHAQKAVYALPESQKIPQEFLKKYCLRGVGPQDGKFVISQELRDRVQFRHESITTAAVKKPAYDIIFLRNVLIYFDLEKKREVVASIMRSLRKGGLLMVGHSETLHGVNEDVRMISPSIYQKN